MINGISWLVVTKLDVLDELAEIPVCVGYKINGKSRPTRFLRRPADTTRSSAFTRTCRAGRLRPRASRKYGKLPKAAREYLAFH